MIRKSIFIFLTLFIIQVSFSDGLYHIVKKGDTLYSLSKKYNVPIKEIMSINNITDPMKIREGYRLLIQKKNIYTVKKGDTLYSIAKNNSVNIRDLLELNKITSNTLIKVGQRIYLPVTIDVDNRPVTTGSNAGTSGNKPVKPEMKPVIVKSSSNADFFWPVEGEIVKLKGKLQGSRISAEKGDPVYSVSTGRVVWEGPYRGFGRVVFIESSGGYVYVYGGNEKTQVSVGDIVEPGSEIGMIGFNIHESKPGIYFSVYKNGEPVDVEKAPRL